MSEKSGEKSRVYKFGPFVLNAREHLLMKGDTPVSLPPKAFDLLLALVESNGSLMRKEDFFDLVWPGEIVEEGNIPYNIALVRKALGDSATDPVYIATVSKQGYRFIEPVSSVTAPEPESEGRVDPGREQAYSPLKTHRRHLSGACTLYALYYSVAFILEIAYQFETYGSRALKFTPLIFSWILVTSLLGLDVGLKRTARGSGIGLFLSVSVFVGAALLLYLAAGLFLPNSAITQASFQTYPAHGAFLKNISCVLPLAVMFLVVPSHYIVALEGGGRSVYLKTSWLVGILIGTFLLAFAGSAHLFENLKPNPNMGLFIQLNQWRLLLYFLLGFECVLWYQHAQSQHISEQRFLQIG